MQDAALERDHCGGGGGACVAFGIVALADYLGAGIKKAGETITDGVRQGDTGQEKKYRQGHLLQKPISRKERIKKLKTIHKKGHKKIGKLKKKKKSNYKI